MKADFLHIPRGLLLVSGRETHGLGIHFGPPVNADCRCGGERMRRVQKPGDIDIVRRRCRESWVLDIQALRAANVPVRAVLRNEVKACRLKAIGCDIAFADLQDSVSLGRAIADAEAVQVILPPSLQAEDVVGKMRQSIESAAQALAQARPKRVLVISNEVLLGVPAKRDRQSNPELYSKQSPDEIQRESVAWKPIGSHGALVMLMSITLHSVESLYPQARQWLCHPPK